VHVFALWRFQHHRHIGKARIVDDQTESVQPNVTLADVFVAVFAAAQIELAVVEVETFELFQADIFVESLHHDGVILSVAEIIAGSQHMAGIEADANPIRLGASFTNGAELLEAVAQVFANAIARKESDLALRESEARLNAVTKIAGAGLWVMEIDTGCVWATPKTRRLFHFSPNEDLNFESFFKAIHPDDHETVRQAVQKTIQSGENLNCEYRVMLPDGNTIWILSSGRRHLSPTGKPVRMMGVSLDITERIEAEKNKEKRLQFEALLSEISTRFVTQPVERIDYEIEDALRRICEFVNIDLSALWQWSDEACHVLKLTHFYSSQDGEAPYEGMSQDHFPWCRQQMLNGQIVSISSLEELPAEAARDRESCRLFGIKSNLTFPLSVEGEPPIGVLGFNTMRIERDWPELLVQRLQLIVQIFTSALERKRMDADLRRHFRKIEALKQRLEQDNLYLKQEVKLLLDHNEIIGQSMVMKKVLSLAEQVAGTEATVIIRGETGTGKGVLAREIHGMSSRKDRPLVTVNCASLPSSLIESELFGREKGAYTGALTRMAGRFEVADKSTIFLDEIGELPFDVQSKLLQVLEDGRCERLGSTNPLDVNVRIIAATNRDLAQDVKEGRFRQDLFYRLNVFPILIPPLCERAEDIPLMVWTFVKEFQRKMGKNIESISRKTMESLQCYHWPGNVRELRNVIEHAMILNKGKNLVVDIPGSVPFETQAVFRLDEMERHHILNILKRSNWRIAGKGGAAEALGLRRTTLYSKMKKLGIQRPAMK